MAKKEITIKMTFEYDPDENGGKPANIMLFHFLTRFNREWPVKEIIYKGIKKVFRTKNSDINKIALRKVDSISDTDLPKKPAWLKDRTILPKKIKQ